MAPLSGMASKRVVIYASDVEMLTGYSRRSAYRLLHNIRVASGKAARSFVTIDEFCRFTGIPKESVLERISG